MRETAALPIQRDADEGGEEGPGHDELGAKGEFTVTGTASDAGGTAQNITLDLKAGRYAVTCFLSDRPGGPPHIARGMIEELVVE